MPTFEMSGHHYLPRLIQVSRIKYSLPPPFRRPLTVPTVAPCACIGYLRGPHQSLEAVFDSPTIGRTLRSMPRATLPGLARPYETGWDEISMRKALLLSLVEPRNADFDTAIFLAPYRVMAGRSCNDSVPDTSLQALPGELIYRSTIV